ncbi:MAG TPA: hypothetical protein VHO25_24825 [Polyangiaceae bacterium]|nr:hypothetical protein [Polyangiaceae bacterium]
MTTTTNPPPAQAGEATESATQYQGKLLGRALADLNAVLKCEGSMCTHCIELLCENVVPMLSRLQELHRADLSRATGETGLTVEACLVELRKMFPLPHDLRIALSDYGRVVTAEIYRDARLLSKGKTLKEAMENLKRKDYTGWLKT